MTNNSYPLVTRLVAAAAYDCAQGTTLAELIKDPETQHLTRAPCPRLVTH